MIQFLLDEDLSPRNAAVLTAKFERLVTSIRDLGMLGQPDHKVFQRAFDENYILITANQRDFEKLASNTELHCGLIIIEDGETTRNEQLEILLIALEKIQQEYDDGRDLANRIFYINSLLEWRFETNPTDE